MTPGAALRAKPGSAATYWPLTRSMPPCSSIGSNWRKDYPAAKAEYPSKLAAWRDAAAKAKAARQAISSPPRRPR